MKGKSSKIIVILVIGLVITLFFAFDLEKYFTFEYLKSSRQTFKAYYFEHQIITIAVYMALYILVTSLSLPGATVMSLAGGALFDLWLGVILVSFASSIGATIAFLASRLLFGDYVHKRFGDKLKSVNEGIAKDGSFYLFTLRLVPLFPFFIINLVMGLTKIPTSIFYIVSQIGMLPATFIYINAGTQLARIESPKGIVSPEVLFSFALLGIFPFITKKIVSIVRLNK